jgi:hypothetical protein
VNIKTGDRVVRNETGEAGVIDAVFEATETNPARGSFRGDVRGKQGLVGLGEFRLEEGPVRSAPGWPVRVGGEPVVRTPVQDPGSPAATQPKAAKPEAARAKKKPAAKKAAAKGTAAKRAPKKKRP